MKMLLFTEQFPPLIGGAANYLFNLFKNLAPEDTVVYTSKRPQAQEFDHKQKMKIIRGWIWDKPFWPPNLESLIGPFCLLVSIVRAVIKDKIGIIHCGNVHPFGNYGLFFKVFFNIPYVVYTFAEEITMFKRNRFKKKVISLILKRADAVISISNFTKNELIDLGVSQESIQVIGAGVDPGIFFPKDAGDLKKKLGIENKKVILTLARLGERKNQETVIRALPQVIEKVPGVVYVIVGSGPQEAKLKKLVKDMGLDDHVIFIEGVSHEATPQYYSLCDVYILPCREIESTGNLEGFPLVFLEANACGKPVIGGRAGGSEDAIEDGQTGILLNKATDAGEVAQAIVRLLLDEALSRDMGERGRKRAHECFSWDILAEKLKEVSARIVTKNK